MVTSSGTVINSNLYSELTMAAIRLALNIDISGGSGKYIDFLVDVENEIVTRISDLFSCFIETQVSTLSYTDMDIALKLAWLDKFTGELLTITSLIFFL